VRTEVMTSVGAIPAEAWDRLTGDDDPFVEHAFLSALEESGSVGRAAGWEPMPVTVWEGTRLVGALPLYLKSHSYGEYIFDWAWADAAHRVGVAYYPKLVSMVPVTPATGRRFLYAPDVDPDAVTRRLIDGCFEAASRVRASSIHLLFLDEEERRRVIADGRLMPRLSMQFHWHAEGDRSFDDFVGRFRSSMRKKLRRERRVVEESDVEIRVIEGSDLSPAQWMTLYGFYRDTCHRKGSPPYLTRRFFEIAPARVARRAVVALGLREGEMVAASLNFEKGAHLYGRYWGCLEEHEMLHFELCYYRLIERAIDKGMRRFEAGAQGTHKLRRGLMPSPVHSAHALFDPVLSQAVADFLPREAMQTQRQMLELAEHGPFRREEA